MARAASVAGSTLGAITILGWVRRRFGPASWLYALAVVWVPMAWLGTISRFVTLRLPQPWYRLRRFEQDGGHLYELLGVRVAKRVLRRWPFSSFNPGLHLPAEPDADRLAQLDQRMQDAEATHAMLFVATTGIAVHAARQGRPSAARWMMVWNSIMNGYPLMLQRYNRGLLHRRFGETGR